MIHILIHHTNSESSTCIFFFFFSSHLSFSFFLFFSFFFFFFLFFSFFSFFFFHFFSFSFFFKSPFFGDWCQYKHCLNNCSYPKGSCNIISGECECDSVPNPFNKTRMLHGEEWTATYQGIDCSYCKTNVLVVVLVVVFLLSKHSRHLFQHSMLNDIFVFSNSVTAFAEGSHLSPNPPFIVVLMTLISCFFVNIGRW